MDINQFKKEAHNLVDWMFEYHNNITKYPIKSKAKPGEIYESLQDSIPENGESFDKIFQDFENKIMPGITRKIQIFMHFFQLIIVFHQY